MSDYNSNSATGSYDNTGTRSIARVEDTAEAFHRRVLQSSIDKCEKIESIFKACISLQFVVQDRVDSTAEGSLPTKVKEKVKSPFQKPSMRQVKQFQDTLETLAGRLRHLCTIMNGQLEQEVASSLNTLVEARPDQWNALVGPSVELPQPSSIDFGPKYNEQLTEVKTALQAVKTKAAASGVEAASKKWDNAANQYWDALNTITSL